ncbi:MAG: hypothetical protein D6823_12065 [Chloroflexi bacterium]|nr:MAG: hypothetical protein D6823_12065 [Chloroflexota bacterium]
MIPCKRRLPIRAIRFGVCNNPRTDDHTVIARLTERGTTATGWFVDYTLHLMGSDRRECLYLMLAPGTRNGFHPVCKIMRTRVGTVLGNQGDYATSHRTALLRTVRVAPMNGGRSTMQHDRMLLMIPSSFRSGRLLNPFDPQNISPIEHRATDVPSLSWLVCGVA